VSRDNPKKRSRIFVSHASANLNVAQEVEGALEAAGFNPWLDDSDIRVGVLLGKELRQAIAASQAVVLIWSKPAAASRWVAAEVLTAFHLDRFIVPCVLTAAPLPQFLSRSIYCDLRGRRSAALKRLAEQLKRIPRGRNEFLAMTAYENDELARAIRSISGQQREMLDRLDSTADLSVARGLQAKLDPEMRAAEKRWRYDPTILNLAGYHRKNAYMLRHWEEYCAGRFPADPLLQEADRFFFETLFVNPVDYSALNGLGNVLLFEGELDAAEFFVERAIRCATLDGFNYQEAVGDLKLIRSRTLRPRKRRVKPRVEE
jgi:hypothetical protein